MGHDDVDVPNAYPERSPSQFGAASREVRREDAGEGARERTPRARARKPPVASKIDVGVPRTRPGAASSRNKAPSPGAAARREQQALLDAAGSDDGGFEAHVQG